MKPLGSQPLFAMRINYDMPQKIDTVWVDYGEGKPFDWVGCSCPSFKVRPTDAIDRLDLRCCVGLELIYEPSVWDDKAARLYERLQEYANTITVVSMCFEPDMGWVWDRKYGRLELGDLQWIDKLDEALMDCNKWAGKNNKVKYDEAQSRELKLYADHPWLRGH